MLDPERYYPLDRKFLIERLILVVHELTELRTSLYEAKCEERRVYDSHLNEPADNITQAKAWAESQTLLQRNTADDLVRQVTSQEDERDLVEVLLGLCDDA